MDNLFEKIEQMLFGKAAERFTETATIVAVVWLIAVIATVVIKS